MHKNACFAGSGGKFLRGVLGTNLRIKAYTQIFLGDTPSLQSFKHGPYIQYFQDFAPIARSRKCHINRNDEDDDTLLPLILYGGKESQKLNKFSSGKGQLC